MEFYKHGTQQDVLIISADGGLNHANAHQFVDEIEKLVDSGVRKIIIDCEHLTYISSYGLGLLLRIHKRLQKHQGNVKICRVKGLISNLLELTRLNTVFDIYPSLDRALLAFRPKDEKTDSAATDAKSE